MWYDKHRKTGRKMRMFQLTFQVKTIHSRYNNFAFITANKFECKNKKIQKKLGRTMQLRGYFSTIFEGDCFTANVEIRENQFGQKYLFSPVCSSLVIPEKTEALSKFLQKRIKGLGINRARVIVETLGLDCIEKIIEDDSVLKQFNFSDTLFSRISSQLKFCKKYEEAAIFIQSAGLSLSIANKLYDRYKDDTITIIRENPYQICYDGEITFEIADKLAKECEIKYNHKLRIQTGLLSYINSRIDGDGYTCVYKDTNIYKSKKNFYQLFNQYLKRNGVIKGEITDDEIEKGIRRLIRDKKLVEDGEYLYTPYLYSVEKNVAKYLKRIKNRTFKFCEKKDIDEFLNFYNGYSLDQKQIDAVYNALLNNVSILTGGPGTGKTAVVNVIVQAIKYICKKNKKREACLELLGPTGKAADRIKELTGEEASTIHRRLGITAESRFSDIILDVDYVIIDESSMIDILLMEQLLSAIENNTRIVFVGDINQLPSVGPGKVLDDFIGSGIIPTVTLTKIFRQSNNSTIVTNAHHIINGKDTEHGFELNNGNFHFVEELDSVEIKNRITEIIENLYKNGFTKKDIAILAPKREKDAGTIELNDLFQDCFNANPIEYEIFEKKFKTGDRVIQTKNNYDLNVFNGFVGTIENIYENHGETFFDVEFDNQPNVVTYSETTIHELDLAYAMTVHKSQGSEYPIVIMPIHLSQSNMLTTKILYTAITRAKKEIYLVGDKKAIDRAIHEKNKNKNEYRISRLVERLRN